MYKCGGPLENIQCSYLYMVEYLLRLIYLKVLRRMRSVFMITHLLMIPVHKVVTRKIIVLEKSIQTCARMLS